MAPLMVVLPLIVTVPFGAYMISLPLVPLTRRPGQEMSRFIYGADGFYPMKILFD